MIRNIDAHERKWEEPDRLGSRGVHGLAQAIEFVLTILEAPMKALSIAARHLILAALAFSTAGAGERIPNVRLDVNDVSYLWPAPTTTEESNALISITETGAEGVAIWPVEAFRQAMDAASTVEIATPNGSLSRISLDSSLLQADAWKIVGMRIDPSAPGGSEEVVRQFGSMPQVRLVVQPVTMHKNGKLQVHDVTAHLVYEFGRHDPTRGNRAFPDKARFAAIVQDLQEIKQLAEDAGVPTTGELTVHPGLQQGVPGFADRLRLFVKEHLTSDGLQAIAFMGLDPPEPWIFFAMKKMDGQFVRVLSPQMLTFRGFGNGAVIPALPTSMLGLGEGVSTAALFRPNAPRQLDLPALERAPNEAVPSVRNRDIPDVIANPEISHFFNTDCLSCHTESTRRNRLGIGTDEGGFHYERPDGVSGVNVKMLPTNDWNVRNFGWFIGGKPTVTQRTANEAAESAAFINREYIDAERQHGADPAPAIARPLNLIMSIRSDRDREELKGLLDGIQVQPLDENPIHRAMTSLANVHFAQFVFLDDRKLAVLTTYDGDFEAYIDAFINEIGDVFDQILQHMEGAPPLPVRENRDAFLKYIKRNDRQVVGSLYSAYPTLGVQDILTLGDGR